MYRNPQLVIDYAGKRGVRVPVGEAPPLRQKYNVGRTLQYEHPVLISSFCVSYENTGTYGLYTMMKSSLDSPVWSCAS